MAPLTPVSPPYLLPPAYCCNALDGQWYSYDDSRVEGVPEAEVSTRSAYILFYQRRKAVPTWSAGSSIRGELSNLPATALGTHGTSECAYVNVERSTCVCSRGKCVCILHSCMRRDMHTQQHSSTCSV